jgi:hypothetical protein
MGRHGSGKQRKRGYMRARTLGHRPDDQATARELADDLGLLLLTDDPTILEGEDDPCPLLDL